MGRLANVNYSPFFWVSQLYDLNWQPTWRGTKKREVMNVSEEVHLDEVPAS